MVCYNEIENYFQIEVFYLDRCVVYNTKKKDIIYNVLRKQDGEFRVKDIYNIVKDSVGLTTVYRLIDRLVSYGVIKKYIKDDNSVYYQYLEECDKDNHFYLKCDCCAKLIHVDCDCVRNLFNHILDKHGFGASDRQFVINGICDECRK